MNNVCVHVPECCTAMEAQNHDGAFKLYFKCVHVGMTKSQIMRAEHDTRNCSLVLPSVLTK